MEECQHWRRQEELQETEERIEKTNKEYLENTCTEIMEFQRTGGYDLM